MPHDAHADAGAVTQRIFLYAFTIVDDFEFHVLRGLCQPNGYVTGMSVLQNVVHCLLRDAVEVSGHRGICDENG